MSGQGNPARGAMRYLAQAGGSRVVGERGRAREARPFVPTPETDWDAVYRDYVAGDSLSVLSARYPASRAVIARTLEQDYGVTLRDASESGEIRSHQAAEADAVRYRLRTGSLDAAADRLGVTPQELRAALEEQQLLLHDLTDHIQVPPQKVDLKQRRPWPAPESSEGGEEPEPAFTDEERRLACELVLRSLDANEPLPATVSDRLDGLAATVIRVRSAVRRVHGVLKAQGGRGWILAERGERVEVRIDPDFLRETDSSFGSVAPYVLARWQQALAEAGIIAEVDEEQFAVIARNT